MNINGYNVYRHDRFDSYGGVAILTHKSINTVFKRVSIRNSGIEIIQVQILNCKLLKSIYSIYCPSSVTVSSADWDELFSLSSSNSIIAGDFNGHHVCWSNKSDTRGEQIFDSSLEFGYVSLNDGRPTRVKMVNGVLQQSSPDITFCSSDIAINVTWNVTCENLGSDHLVLKYSLGYQDRLNFIEKRNFAKANWNEYTEFLNVIFSESVSFECVQVMYDWFLEKINSAANKSIPLIKICTNPIRKFTPKQYWNQTLSKAVAERRLALKTLRRNPTPDNLCVLQRKTAEAQRLIRRAKSDSWHTFCDNICETTNVSDMWRKMRWMKGYQHVRRCVSEEKKEELLQSLTPDFVINNTPCFISSNELLESEFTIVELENSLKLKYSAPGNDNISYSMLSHLPLNAKIFLLNIFNRVLVSGYIPIQWRDIVIVPIPKNNDNDPKLRPISLISCICKLFHSMLNKRLEWYLESNKLLSPNTTGFRKGQSCLDNLARLVTNIQVGFSKNNATIACFVDIDGAYNNVIIECLVNILDRLKVGATICQYVWEFSKKRFLKIKVDDANVNGCTRWASKGIAQGDPLSPLLFNVATIDICRNIQNVFISQYADDFVLYSNHNKLSNSIIQMQLSVNTLIHLLSQLGLELAAEKSKLCVFSRGRIRQNVSIFVNNIALESVDCIKHLGVWLDSSLRWTKHIKETYEKSCKFLQIFKVLSGSGWGVHPQHLRRLYLSLIRSRIDYGSFLYDNSAKTNVKKLDLLQNRAMRIVGGYVRSTPVYAMESDLCIPPLVLRRKYLAFKYILKSRSFEGNLTVKYLSELALHLHNNFWSRKKKPLLADAFIETGSENIASAVPLENFSLDTWMSSIDIKKFIKPNIDCISEAKCTYEVNHLKNIVLQELNLKYDGWHSVYTDGSKDSAGRGASFFNPNSKVQCLFRINSCVSVMSVELLAIYEAVLFIEKNNICKIVILTDSKSSLQHIIRCVSGERGLAIAYKIISKLINLCKRGIKVMLQWIPSHVGLQGNEEADRLAKKAIKDGNDVEVVASWSEVLAKYRQFIRDNWREYFNKISKEKGIWYRSIVCEPPRIPWFSSSRLNRQQIVMALRLRSGHIPLNKFGFLMGKVTSPKCDECGVEDDVYHFLMECVRNASRRQQLVDKFNINRIDVGVFQSILAEPWSEAAKLLYYFKFHS